MTRSLLLFNNTTVPGVANATQIVGPTYVTYDSSNGNEFATSRSDGVLEEISMATKAPLWGKFLASGAYAPAFDPTNGFVYVAGGGTGNLSVVDPLTQNIVAAPTIGNTLIGDAWDPNVGSIVVADFGNNRLDFFDPTTDLVNLSLNVGSGPVGVAVDPANGEVVVTNELSSNFTVIGGSPLHVLKNLPSGYSPDAVNYIPSQNEWAITNGASENVSLWNAATWALKGSVTVGSSPEGTAYDPTDGDLLVPDFGSGNVSVVNVTKLQSEGSLTGYQEPLAASYDAAQGEMVIALFITNNLSVVQASDLASVGSINTGATPADVVMDTDNGLLYLADTFPGGAIVIDPVNFKVVRWIDVGNAPSAISFDPAQNEVFVADGGLATNQYNGSISVISGSSETVVATLAAPPMPNDVVYDPIAHEVFVSEGGSPYNGFSGNVSVIDPVTNTVVSTIKTGLCPDPDGLAYDPDDELVLVACDQGPGVDEINTTTDTVVGVYNIGAGISNEVLDTFNGLIYMTDVTNDIIRVFDPATLQVIKNISTGLASPTDLDVDTDNGDVACAVEEADQVYVLNENSTIAAIFPSALGPDAIGFDPIEGAFFVDDGAAGVEEEVPVLTAEFFRATPAVISLGNSTDFDTYVPDGNATQTFSYANLPPGCTSSNTSLLPCTPTLAGNYSIYVTVIDVYGKTATDGLTLTVNKDPHVDTFSASPSPVADGGTTTLSVLAVLGTPPYHYVYTGLPPGCSSASTDALACTPNTPGSYEIGVFAYDSFDEFGSGWLNLTVLPGPSVTSFTPAPTMIVLGGSTTFLVTTEGGSPPLSYAYGGALTSECASADTSTWKCTPNLAGTYNVSVTVTDASGLQATAYTSLTVVPLLELSSLTATPDEITLGQSATISTAVKGGTGAYTFAYVSSPSISGPSCDPGNLSSFACAPTSSGTYALEVVVTDTSHQRVVGFANLTVEPSTSVSGSFLLVVVGAVVAVVVVAVVVLFLFLRRRRASPNEPPPPVDLYGQPLDPYGAPPPGYYPPGPPPGG